MREERLRLFRSNSETNDSGPLGEVKGLGKGQALLGKEADGPRMLLAPKS